MKRTSPTVELAVGAASGRLAPGTRDHRVAGMDTRALTVRIRNSGAPSGVLAIPADAELAALRRRTRRPGSGRTSSGVPAGGRISGIRAVGVAARAGRPLLGTTWWRSITGRSATSCATSPRRGAG